MRHPFTLPVLLFALVLSTGCFSAGPTVSDGKGGETTALGTMRLSSAVLGKMTVSPDSCQAGDRQFFFGGDFADARAGVTVRLVVDPLGEPAVRVFATDKPFDKSVVFRRGECRTFHFSLDTTMWRINDVQDYKLTLDLDCVNKDGEAIEGKLAANHCH